MGEGQRPRPPLRYVLSPLEGKHLRIQPEEAEQSRGGIGSVRDERAKGRRGRVSVELRASSPSRALSQRRRPERWGRRRGSACLGESAGREGRRRDASPRTLSSCGHGSAMWTALESTDAGTCMRMQHSLTDLGGAFSSSQAAAANQLVALEFRLDLFLLSSRTRRSSRAPRPPHDDVCHRQARPRPKSRDPSARPRRAAGVCARPLRRSAQVQVQARPSSSKIHDRARRKSVPRARFEEVSLSVSLA